ncbi:hypothetical protein EcMakalu001_109 [Escherichia phage Ec_Makalu_001]|uniref:Uncharacterized protein n=3 Tax=Krischvirus gec3s TaxID=2560444 RepID=A0A6B9SQ53_9CAUD|nr:hypothetical protein Makalu002_110 [Escherichia phage Ec_Makalu_002]QHJ73059.1 hypothetical protein Makalu003_111 [Escherichia phage Ec_Makalu_003]QHJ73330.1 hypothetical protein EcMakalu001_109 [Escherichia phage Ec_Makalu_001]
MKINNSAIRFSSVYASFIALVCMFVFIPVVYLGYCDIEIALIAGIYMWVAVFVLSVIMCKIIDYTD